MAAVPSQDIRFGRAVCGVLAAAERREWWLTNGRGAYAAGTIALSATRRYHGLLVAPLRPPLGRHVVLAKADASLVAGGRQWPLFTNRWHGGAIEPKGHLHIESFHLDGRMPVWRFAFGALRLEMRIWMEYGADATWVAYRLDAPDYAVPHDAHVRVRLLANARDHHGEIHAGAFHARAREAEDRRRLAIDLASESWLPTYTLHLATQSGWFAPRHDWIKDFDLAIERERGLSDRDHHLCVGEATLDLVPGVWTGFSTSTAPLASADIVAALERSRARDAALLDAALRHAPELATAPEWVRRLVLAADSFVFARSLPDAPEGKSVIAGYPWFGEWGRDTMIALPGLTLTTGRPEIARQILETFARFVDRGMLPNVFPGSGDVPEYNTADAALWFVEGWRAYVAATGDVEALHRALPVLEEIIVRYCDGTRYGIAMDPADGLLRAGELGVQVTWMDAKVGDWVVTPRIGKPVEINALWFNALISMGAFADRLGSDGGRWRALAETVHRGFQRFLVPETGGLYDVLDGPDGNDATVRPNQIFAVSLPASPLDHERQERIVALCARELLTTYGLRSLAPSHPDFRAVYEGGVWERDGAYHQGPVWTWLLGPFALAEYRVTGDAAAAQTRLAPIGDHLADAGLGTVSEICDGAPPHTPRGTPAQAWSVACTLEAWLTLERAKRAEAAPDRTAKMRTPRRVTPA